MPKHRVKKPQRMLALIGFLPLLLAVISVSSAVIYYQSRRVPDLGEQYQVTELPSEVTNVLGEKAEQPAEPPERVPILLYHYVEYVKDKGDTTRQSLDILPSTLTLQIETLKQDGYSFITPSDLTSAVDGKSKLPAKSVILSFDDGYMDFYTDVFPILEKEQVKGVAYIIPDFLNRPNYMYTSQLKEVAKSPYVEIGAHTLDHTWLKGTSKVIALREISQSKTALQNLLDIPIKTFAYPYGAFDEQALQLVQDSGFDNAVSTVPGINQSSWNKYFFYRLRPGGRTGQTLLTYLKQDTFKAY